MQRAVWALGLAVLGCMAGRARAAPLSRRRAVELAMQQNPLVAAARADVLAIEALKRQADAARYPAIELIAGVGPALKATLVPGTAIQSVESSYHNFAWSDLTAFFRGDLTVTQPLYTFGKIGHRREAGEHGIRARKAQVELTKADIAVTVAQLYEGLLLARDAVRVFEEVDHTLAGSVNDTEERLRRKAAQVGEDDLLRLQTARSLAHLQLDQARAGVAETTAGLAAYLGLPLAEVAPREVELAPLRYPLGDVQRLVGVALEERPELVALSEGAVAYRRLAAAEHAAYLPDFFALALVSGAYTPGRDLVETRFYADPLNHFYPGLFVGVHWSVQGDMASRRADEQRAAALRLEETRRWALAGIPAEVRRAYEEALRADRDLAETKLASTRAKQWLVRTTADYSMALGDSRSVSDSAMGYVLVRTAQLEALFRWNVALAELARATGTLARGTGPYPGADEMQP